MRTSLARSLTIVAGVVAVLCPIGYLGLVPANPVLVINARKDVKVFIDGHQVQFQHGTFAFSPWKLSYRVVIEMPDKRIERRVYPWTGNDTASINVDGNRCNFNITNSEV